jgi:LEA14-like dessication related protein
MLCGDSQSNARYDWSARMQQARLYIRTRLVRFSLLLAPVLLASCAGAGVSIERPAVTLSGVEMSSLSFSGQTFLLSFDVNNPNPFPLPIRSVRYQLQLADQSFAGGETQGDFSIPASGDGVFDISVRLDILKSAGQLSSVLRSGMRKPVSYELNGSLAIDIPFLKPVPFSTSGVITIASN